MIGPASHRRCIHQVKMAQAKHLGRKRVHMRPTDAGTGVLASSHFCYTGLLADTNQRKAKERHRSWPVKRLYIKRSLSQLILLVERLSSYSDFILFHQSFAFTFSLKFPPFE